MLERAGSSHTRTRAYLTLANLQRLLLHAGGRIMSALRKQRYERLTPLVHSPSSLGKCYSCRVSADAACGLLVISLSRLDGET